MEIVWDERGGATLLLDGHPQSYVQPDDPGLLVFQYVERMAMVVDAFPAGPLRVTHVGGGALTLPRYVEATRPGSPQIVLEPDTALTELVRAELPLPRRHRIRVRPVTGEQGLAALADASADVVVLDAYAGGQVPAPLVAVEQLAAMARVLAPGGVLLANLADEPARRWVGRVVAGITAVGLLDSVLLADFDVVKRKRFGNYLVAAARPGDLPREAIGRRVGSLATPTGVREASDLVAGARRFTAADAQPSPPPPDSRRWRRS